MEVKIHLQYRSGQCKHHLTQKISAPHGAVTSYGEIHSVAPKARRFFWGFIRCCAEGAKKFLGISGRSSWEGQDHHPRTNSFVLGGGLTPQVPTRSCWGGDDHQSTPLQLGDGSNELQSNTTHTQKNLRACGANPKPRHQSPTFTSTLRTEVVF